MTAGSRPPPWSRWPPPTRDIPARLRDNYRLPVILAVIGVVQFVEFLNGHPHDDGGIVAAVVGSLVLAAVFGALRAPTVRVWRENGSCCARAPG